MRGEQAVAVSHVRYVAGSPPLARGAAGVRWWPDPPLDHPRVRGEQWRNIQRELAEEGSPLRARGAVPRPLRSRRRPGITPACAGSRRSAHRPGPAAPDHPRVRGEQGGRGSLLPDMGGITPACAGSRPTEPGGGAGLRDHPRMRGEQDDYIEPATLTGGSPPHARGAARERHEDQRKDGITPACAGSRESVTSTTPTTGDHPRMRGEQLVPPPMSRSLAGSPPHARGAVTECRRRPVPQGITPACAGSR